MHGPNHMSSLLVPATPLNAPIIPFCCDWLAVVQDFGSSNERTCQSSCCSDQKRAGHSDGIGTPAIRDVPQAGPWPLWLPGIG